jgi:tetratricopeptide (TPR) repeat protein
MIEKLQKKCYTTEYYSLSLTTYAEKEACYKKWLQRIPYSKYSWVFNNVSTPAIDALFMLSGVLSNLPLKISENLKDIWFYKAKASLELAYKNNPNDIYVLILLKHLASSPSEYWCYLQKIIEVDPLFTKYNSFISHCGRYRILEELFNLLEDNTISDEADKKKAETIITNIFTQNKDLNNRDAFLYYWRLLYECRVDKEGKIACIRKILEIDPNNSTARELNKKIGNIVPIVLYKCALCECYTDTLIEGLCDSCYKQVDHSDHMDTYRELSDPFDEGIDMFED